MGGRILIVGKRDGRAGSLSAALLERGYQADLFEDASLALEKLAHGSHSVVVVEGDDRERYATLESYGRAFGSSASLLVMGCAEFELARRAIQCGAVDVLVAEEGMSSCIERIEAWARPGGPKDDPLTLIGGSPAIAQLHEQIARLDGHDDTTITLLGETGTGKSCVARLLHERSRRAREPFVTVDCTTLAHTLVESELFGHEKGAFSGAVQTRRGWVEEAGAGTLFLDEIGELSLDLQTKLLSLLEAKEFSRVGGRKRIPFRARVIAATNRNLAEEVARGRFRRDLYYRLDVFTIELPPLRKRGRDVITLTRHFASRRAEQLGWPGAPEIDEALEAALLAHPFEGNVRELRNMVERAMMLPRPVDLLTLEHFPALTRTTRPSHVARIAPDSVDRGSEPPLRQIREAAEEREVEAITESLTLAGGNVSQAARLLGISRHRLYRRMQKFGLR
ncbi:MAG: sigma-54-dependent Fis family transcriptional regulator [Myxococcales bacterium]|nr:sigma-54-dependent Fis family transcriptional regulator [Myxococcales bacterium]